MTRTVKGTLTGALLLALGVAAIAAKGAGSTAQSAANKVAGNKAASQVNYTLEQLDSAANLLMTVADSDKPGFCGVTPSQARSMLMALHPILDEKRKGAVAQLSSRPSGKPIANPKWDQSCLGKCHCGLYASILEGVGEARLVPRDREMLDRMASKARVMTREHMQVCARTSPWFCKSDLLTRLKEEARNYPDSTASPSPRAR